MDHESAYRKSKRIEFQTDQTATYLLGKCEQLCADYARSQGLSEVELTRRVGELLYTQAGGKIHWPQHNLPGVRGEAPSNGALGGAAMALDERPSGAAQAIARQQFENLNQQQMAAALYSQGIEIGLIAQKLNVKRSTVRTYLAREGVKYEIRKPGKHKHTYNGTHWTQRPENRAKMMRIIRRAKRAKKNGGR